MSFFGRLRTQLILSHLVAIACTLVAMVTAVVILGGSWFMGQQASLASPSQQARTVAASVGGIVARGNNPSDLNAALRLLASGDLNLSAGSTAWAPSVVPIAAKPGDGLHDVAFIVVFGPDGRTVASSQPTGASYLPSDSARWDPLVRAALAGDHDLSQLASIQPASQPPAIGVYPILDSGGKPIAAILVALRSCVPASGSSFSFWHSLSIIGAASAAVLTAASIFALISASIVGYYLSRRLVARLERLGRGVEALADGDLSRRVEEGPSDEVGRLARRFNAMAERLSTTVAELSAAKIRAEAALRAKRELVANVSHELRTPLALIHSHVEALQMRGSLGDPVLQDDYLAIVARETENLSHLIDDLFALSTAETGALALAMEPIALGDVVRDVAGSIAPLARRERQIAVVATVAENLPPVWADRRRVVQVLGNLTRNALRYTPEGGLIAVRAERQDGRVEVSVEDTGEGIPPERLSHVFERFYRGDDARDRASGGAGLGLAIVRELVEAMGGDVAAASVVGQGSRFSFRLPGRRGIGTSRATSRGAPTFGARRVVQPTVRAFTRW